MSPINMKHRYLLICISFLSAGFLQAQVQLFDQTENPETNGLVAQDFEPLFDGNDCRIADDFDVPTGDTWYIDSLKIYGFYNVNNPDSAGMNITIYENNNGAIGSSVYTNVFQVNLDQDGDGAIKAVWNTPLQLTAGSYWLAASARKNYITDQGVWYWYLESSGYGEEAKWENPGGAWNAGCTSWTDITDNSCVNVQYPDVVFDVYGCCGPNKPTINPLPADTTFCEGDQTTLTATSNSSGVNFAWNTGDSTATVVANQNGVYSVTAYDPTTLCGAVARTQINVIPAPISTVSDDTICEGQTRSYAGICSSCLFAWSDGSTSSMITKTTTDQVRVTMTDTATGCVNADTGWLEVVPLPEIDFYPGNPANGCEGDTMEFGTATNFTTYIWDSPGWTSISDTTSFSVMENGTYYLTVTNSIGCQASDTLEVIFHPPPVPNVMQSYTKSWKTKLTADEGYQTYLWSNGDDDIEITTWKTGVFSLTVTDEYGCEGEASLFVISIPQGLEELDENVFSAYPNPATNVLSIEFARTPSGNARLELMDASRKLVFKETPNKPLSIIDISKLPRGCYILKYQNDVGLAIKQIVLQ
jgi:hypothetical protein